MGCCCSKESEKERADKVKKHNEGNLRQEDDRRNRQNETITNQPKELAKSSSEASKGKKHNDGNNLHQDDNRSNRQSETITDQPKEHVKSSSEFKFKGESPQEEGNVDMKSDRGKKKAVPPTSRTEADRQLDMERAKEVIKPLAEFSLSLFKKIAAENSEENVVLSPICIALALALVESGANGSTRTALRNALGGNGNDFDPSAAYQAIQRLLRSHEGDTPFTIANGLFHDQTFKLKPEYLSNVKEGFEAEIDRVDFENAKESAVLRINSWISNRTEGRIRNLLQSAAISDKTAVILANAIYLKPKWRKAFRKAAIEKMPFFRRGQDENPQKVPFLCDVDYYMYADDTDFHAVGIPYSSVNQLYFYIILPKERNGIRKVEEQLTEAKLRSIVQTSTRRRIDLKFPKFMFRTPVALTSILNELGLGPIFETNADFSRMKTDSDDRLFHVDGVYHEAFIKVDEYGTEAAAATGMSNPAYVTLRPPIQLEKPIRFVAEHPFIFAIIHRQTETVVFIGKVNCVKEEDVN